MAGVPLAQLERLTDFVRNDVVTKDFDVRQSHPEAPLVNELMRSGNCFVYSALTAAGVEIIDPDTKKALYWGPLSGRNRSQGLPDHAGLVVALPDHREEAPDIRVIETIGKGLTNRIENPFEDLLPDLKTQDLKRGLDEAFETQSNREAPYTIAPFAEGLRRYCEEGHTRFDPERWEGFVAAFGRFSLNAGAIWLPEDYQAPSSPST